MPKIYGLKRISPKNVLTIVTMIYKVWSPGGGYVLWFTTNMKLLPVVRVKVDGKELGTFKHFCLNLVYLFEHPLLIIFSNILYTENII